MMTMACSPDCVSNAVFTVTDTGFFVVAVAIYFLINLFIV